MEIIYLHQYFNTPAMQGSTRSYEMAKRLVDRGHIVRIVTSWRDPTSKKGWFVTNEDGIEVHWIPVPYGNEMTYGARMRAFLRFATSSARRAVSLPGNVVFATSTPLTISIPGIYAAWRKKLPFVFEVRDLWPEMPIAIGAIKNRVLIWAARRLERFAYRHSKRIVALSPGMAEGITQTGYSADQVTIIPNSCDLDLFRPDPEKAAKFLNEHPELKGGPIVLYAGTLGRVNGVDYMVKLATQLIETAPHVRFVILGSGSELHKTQSLARELGVLDKNLFFYEQLPKSEVVAAFSAATVITSWTVDIPATEKNSANKFFDGLAAARPVAINYGGWQADLLTRFEAGFVLSRDVREAAQTLIEWLNDGPRLLRAGQNARQLGESQFSRDVLATKLEQVLIDSLKEQ